MIKPRTLLVVAALAVAVTFASSSAEAARRGPSGPRFSGGAHRPNNGHHRPPTVRPPTYHPPVVPPPVVVRPPVVRPPVVRPPVVRPPVIRPPVVVPVLPVQPKKGGLLLNDPRPQPTLTDRLPLPLPFPVPANGPLNNALPDTTVPGWGVRLPNGTILHGGYQALPDGGAAGAGGIIRPNGLHLQFLGLQSPDGSGGGFLFSFPLK